MLLWEFTRGPRQPHGSLHSCSPLGGHSCVPMATRAMGASVDRWVAIARGASTSLLCWATSTWGPVLPSHGQACHIPQEQPFQPSHRGTWHVISSICFVRLSQQQLQALLEQWRPCRSAGTWRDTGGALCCPPLPAGHLGSTAVLGRGAH